MSKGPLTPTLSLQGRGRLLKRVVRGLRDDYFVFLLFPNTQYPIPNTQYPMPDTRIPPRSGYRSLSGMPFAFSNHAAASLSLGARQSPRGESDPPEPTLGPLGMQERLNWLVWKNRWR